MAVDAWLDTQCGVPEITVSPDECSCEDSSKVYRLLQCQIQGAIPYGKVNLPHLDARYVATLYQYLKQFVVLNRNETLMVCMDDKAVVPVGDPGMPLSTSVRPHNRVLAATEGPELVAMDHGFCISGLACPILLKSRPLPYSHNEIIKKSFHSSHFTKSKIQRSNFFY